MGRSGYDTSNSAPGSAAAASADDAHRRREGLQTPRATSPVQGPIPGTPENFSRLAGNSESESTPRPAGQRQQQRHAPAAPSGLASSSVFAMPQETSSTEPVSSSHSATTLPPVREVARCPPIRAPHVPRQTAGTIGLGRPALSPVAPPAARAPAPAPARVPATVPVLRPFVTGQSSLADPFGPTPRASHARSVSAGWQPYPAQQRGSRMGYTRPYSPIPAECPA